MEAGMITTVLLVACATICIGVGIFYFFINNTKNKGRICILLLGIGGGIWALGSALYGNCTDDRLAQDFFCMTIVGFNLYVIAIVIYVACVTGVKIKGYGLMVGLGILTSLCFFWKYADPPFLQGQWKNLLYHRISWQRVLSLDVYYALLFVLHLYCTILVEENYA